MKKLILLVLLVGVCLVGYLAIKKLIHTTPAPAVTEEETIEQQKVIGNIWEENIGEKTGLPSKEAEFTPPTLDPLPSLPAPSTKPTVPPTLTNNTVKVGNGLGGGINNPLSGEATPTPPPSSAIDPRAAESFLQTTGSPKNWEKMTQEERMGYEYEPTNLFVQRTFIAPLPNGQKQSIRIKIPVVYQSRLLRLNEDNKKKAEAILARTIALRAKLQDVKKESEALLKDWNQLVRESTPRDALMPESPSLPENQSNSPLNRPEDGNTLEPGKEINLQVQ